MNRSWRTPPLWLGVIFVTMLADGAERSTVEPARRARHPKFDPSAAARIFFEDVFSAVSGDRPQAIPPVAAEAAIEPAKPSAESADRPITGSSWTAVVSATTLEDEVKGSR